MQKSSHSAIIAMVLAWPALQATTLEKLTLDSMIAQSTAIVHVKVTGASPVVRGRNIYTVYQFQAIETLKAGAGPQTEVSVPGGSAGGMRQMVAGAPALNLGGEYVIFLWTSKSGLTQVIGLSQGLFNVMQDSSGNAVLVRPALTGELVLNKAGQVTGAPAVTISLSDLKAQIAQAAGASK